MLDERLMGLDFVRLIAAVARRLAMAPLGAAGGGGEQEPLLLRAAKGQEVERVPVWMMRQAGRHMEVGTRSTRPLLPAPARANTHAGAVVLLATEPFSVGQVKCVLSPKQEPNQRQAREKATTANCLCARDIYYWPSLGVF